MITDRLTARVIGLLLIILPLIIDVSSFIFGKPELRSRPGYALIVILPSLPFLIGGALLLRRAERMKDGDDD
ncbi:hypothetical protein AKJ09_05276 [Labilithrix luteola]|uniref:Uncharacterized protein n=1 Tax=Labilithrix luteola TaxID=1391654 RepID=A0A0K1PYN4_9BACT|nr:hypothetical protein [Labilithrix luteola]AKU98612.1 hypothetical protein AKJ09_05276 [Labilithrix luteola]